MIKKLEQKIKELVPDINKLEMGCRVDVGWRIPHYVMVISKLKSNKYSYDQHTERKYEGMQDIIEYRDNFTIERTPIGEISKILGKKIGIREVLLALKEKDYFVEQCDEGFEGEFAFYICHIYGGELKRIDDYIKWNLQNDDLTKQKSEVIEFLHDILC